MGGGRNRGGSDGFKSAFGDMLTQQQDSGAMRPSGGSGGLFGSGKSGEDWVNILSRAAALAQGDYGSAVQIGQLIDQPRRRQQKRDEDFQDWQRQYDYQVDHAKPVNNDTVADYEYIRQNLGEDAAKQFLQNKADPPQYRQGPDGQFYRIETKPTGPLPTFTEDDWNSAGGAGSSTPRTFPPRY